MYSRDQLAEGFRGLGVTPGDTVLLHASVRAVGEIAGGPDQIHLALKRVLTVHGTLMMYASCPNFADEVGRGNLTPQQEQEILEKLPPYDPLTARSQRENGTLVEFLRTYPGSRVNSHVARFVSWGKQTDYLLSDQPWNYAFGLGSPLERFSQLDGKILLLGCDHDNVTFLHFAEHIVDVPDKRVARFRVPIEEDGQRVWREMEEFDTSGTPVHPSWPKDLFSRLVGGFLEKTGNAGGRVGSAQSYLLSARALLGYSLPIMKSLAGDATVSSRAK